MARRSGKPGCGWVLLILICVAAAVLLSNVIRAKTAERRAEKAEQEAAAIAQSYDESMRPLAAAGYVCLEGADKAVAYEINGDAKAFVDAYIIQEMKAQSYEDVRYLVTVACKGEKEYFVQIKDLLTGELLAERDSQDENDESPFYSLEDGETVFPWLPAAIEEGHYQLAIQAYHENMAQTLNAGSYNGGFKAVSLIYEEEEFKTPVYQTRYIPESMQTEDPNQVRYVIHCKPGIEKVGFYTFGGAAYKRTLSVEVVDLKTGETVLKNTFMGGEPPRTTTNNESQYGDPPTDESVTSWMEENVGPLAEADIYHEAMVAVLESGDMPLAGNKAVSLVFASAYDSDGTYKTDYLPEDRRTEDPALVRYVVECRFSEEGVCWYSDFSTGYQRILTVRVIDLTTDKAIKTEVFEGSQPPSQKTGFGAAYGDPPKEETVRNWLEEVFASRD